MKADVLVATLSRYPNSPFISRRLLSRLPDSMPSYSALLKPSLPVAMFAPKVPMIVLNNVRKHGVYLLRDSSRQYALHYERCLFGLIGCVWIGIVGSLRIETPHSQ